ncbi:GtrA family protein [Clavibacter sp. VKM Ac-2873]|uniref:GtrA family protein n=1 Tax=Clavibacter sp. VKM Ac-2873 TaxID=2783813 RepID=UPI00188D5CBA|nr:GtrA family protein [Clavibacter sp. VKM Ac-2873]MBF4617305.1 GtrA family protein [Clavibacter sp. VKM Ac-2873]
MSPRRPLASLGVQLAQFGVVGGAGFVVDLAVFNLLRATVLHPDAVEAGPLLAKVASTVVAIAVNWVGNRYWTFGTQRTTRRGREALEFLAVSVVGMAIGLACLFVSHYVLGLTSPLADNVSANVVGLGLGSAVRFVLYRQWVYSPARRHAAPPASARADDVDRVPVS